MKIELVNIAKLKLELKLEKHRNENNEKIKELSYFIESIQTKIA